MTNTPSTSEKAKRKNKPKSMGGKYSFLHVLVLVIVAAIGILFFWTIVAMKIGPITSIYISPLIATLLLLAIPLSEYVFVKHTSMMPNGQHRIRVKIALFVAVGLIAIIKFVPHLFISVSSLFVFISPFILVVIVVFVIGGWLFQMFHPGFFTQKFINRLMLVVGPITFIAMTAGFGYLMGWYQIEDSQAIDGRNYILINDHSEWEPWYYPELYVCNGIVLECEHIFNGPTQYSENQNEITLTTGDQDNILVLVDGEVVYDSSQGSP